jgi:hypothetical protein
MNDWITVTNLADGAEKGEIRVSLAAGTQYQIHRFYPELRLPSESEVSKGHSESDEHVYDSVHGPTSSNSSEVESADSEPIILPQRPPNPLTPVAPVHKKPAHSTARPPKEATEETSSEIAIDLMIEEARNLPKVFDTEKNEKVLPSTFVTFSSSKWKSLHQYRTSRF